MPHLKTDRLLIRLEGRDYEVGWHLRRSAWGKGYATEAGRAALNYGFTVLGLPIIYAVTHPQNYASMRVAQRLGMTHRGRTNRYYDMELDLFEQSNPYERQPD